MTISRASGVPVVECGRRRIIAITARPQRRQSAVHLRMSIHELIDAGKIVVLAVPLIHSFIKTRRAKFEAREKESGQAIVALLCLLCVVSVVGLARGGK